MNTNLIPCPACGKLISPQAAACPQCAQPIAPAKNNTQGINLRDPIHILGVALALLMLLGIAFYIFTAVMG